MLQNIVAKIKVHKIISGIILAAVLVSGYLIFKANASNSGPIRYVIQSVSKQTVINSVSGTGQVAASDQLDLKPQTSGTITSVRVSQGQLVKAGQVIATIDQQTASSQLSQARASLSSAKANYDKILAGATSNAVASAQLSLNSAKQAVDTANNNLIQVTAQQQLAVNRAYSNLLNSNLQADASDSFTTATIAVTGNYTGTSEGSYIVSLFLNSSGYSYSVSGLGNSTGPVNRGLAEPIGNGLYITFSTTGTINPSTSWEIDLPNLKSTSYLANYNAYTSAQQTQTQTIGQAQNAITSAQNSLQQAQISYDNTVQPPLPADVASAQAQVDSAEASLQAAQNNYSNTIITAPFDGVIAALTAKKGDQATSGTAIGTLITKEQIIKISLNELDAAKVQVGQKVTATFDAIDSLTLTGKVAQIDSIGTVTQGVVTYNVQISLDTQDDRVKPGMSVTANIIIDVKADVLAVPNSAIKTGAGGSYVQTFDPSQTQSTSGQTGVTSSVLPKQVNVQTGLVSDSLTEIVSGINEGDSVVTQTINPATAKTTATSATSALRIGGGAAGGFTGGARATTGR